MTDNYLYFFLFCVISFGKKVVKLNSLQKQKCYNHSKLPKNIVIDYWSSETLFQATNISA